MLAVEAIYSCHDDDPHPLARLHALDNSFLKTGLVAKKCPRYELLDGRERAELYSDRVVRNARVNSRSFDSSFEANASISAHVGSIPRGKHFFSRCSTSCVMVVAYFTSAHSRMCWKRYSHCNSRLCSLAILRAKLAGTMSTVRGRCLSTRLILAEA